MDTREIALLRTKTQQIGHQYFDDIENLVHYMGALQSQDFAMSKWAIGLRVKGATEALVEKAISESRLVRAHLLRPTWHTVSSKDIGWMLELTAPQIKPLLKSHTKQLGLTEEILLRSAAIAMEAFKNKSFSRDEFKTVLEAGGIATEGQRPALILFYLELEGIIGSGEVRNKQHTYSLLSDLVTVDGPAGLEDQLSELAWRYFNSHGPATLEDFTWWSGLQISKARKALEMISDKLLNAAVGKSNYWYAKSLDTAALADNSISLLPAYDEFVISYKDRSAMVSPAYVKHAINNNGIFWPVIVFNGQVIGTWSRMVKKDKVLVKPVPFKSFTVKQKKLVENGANKFGAFLGLKTELVFE